MHFFTEKLDQLFADLVKHTGDVPVSTAELIQIKKALGMQASKWYRCSKGEWGVKLKIINQTHFLSFGIIIGFSSLNFKRSSHLLKLPTINILFLKHF
jgi:hypothetical protein